MKALRRLIVGLQANFDWMASQLENHEALVDSAIREVQRARAKAKVQLATVTRDGHDLALKLEQAKNDIEVWKDRAIKIEKQDEAKALECLRRKRRAEKERQYYEQELKDHSRIEANLQADIRKITEKLDSLSRQRNILRTRQSRANALQAAQVQDTGILSDIESIIERWEIQITETECCTNDNDDTFEDDFNSEEERALLRAELESLRGTTL